MTQNHSEENPIPEKARPYPDTTNESALHTGQNMPNHSTSLTGRGKFVSVGMNPVSPWRTRQEIYRFCAWALLLAEIHDLPDEAGEHTFEEVQEAIATEIKGE